jgi:hypothetical protein
MISVVVYGYTIANKTYVEKEHAVDARRCVGDRSNVRQRCAQATRESINKRFYMGEQE